MKYLKKYSELNERLRAKMVPKPDKDVLKSLEHLSDNLKLIRAVENNHISIVRKVLDGGNPDLFHLKKALRVADGHQYTEIREIILRDRRLREYLLTLPKEERFRKGVDFGDLDLVQSAIDDGYREHLTSAEFIKAIFSKNYDMVKLFLDNETRANVDDNLGLLIAINIIKDEDIAKLLVDRGANLDSIINSLKKSPDTSEKSLEIIRNLEGLNEGLRDKMTPKSDEEILDELMDDKEPHLILKQSLRNEFIKGIKIIVDNHDITDRKFKNVFIDYITYLSNPDHVKYLLDNGDVRNHFNNLQLYALEKFYFGKYDGKTTTIEDLLKEQMDRISIEEDPGVITGIIRNSRIFIYGKEQKILISSKLNIVSTMSNHNFLEIENNYLALLLAVVVSEKFDLDIEKTININSI